MTRCPDVDLTTASLELARDSYPDLDFAPVFQWINDRAAELIRPVNLANSEKEALQSLGQCIAQEHGITGCRDAYESSDGSYLHKIVETKRGIPISLSILYMAVAQRVGLHLQGVSAPGHFITRYESLDGPIFVDPFHGGILLTLDEAVGRVQQMGMLSRAQAETCLEPVGPRPIILRMLNNLKALYAKQGNWAAAWIVQHRLTCLLPATYSEKRDLAFISLRAQRTGQAIDLLECCLHSCPGEERELLERQLEEARKQLVRWN
ncbi:MAG: transglutaminase-like domain-containing protein [Planctomycetales bacterium]